MPPLRSTLLHESVAERFYSGRSKISTSPEPRVSLLPYIQSRYSWENEEIRESSFFCNRATRGHRHHGRRQRHAPEIATSKSAARGWRKAAAGARNRRRQT